MPQRPSPTTRLAYFYDVPGTVPGTLQAAASAASTQLDLIDYNADTVMQLSPATPEDCAAYLDTTSVSWINVRGLGHAATLQELGQVFTLHPLVLEDLVNVPQRPKVENYGDQLVIVTQMVTYLPQQNRLVHEQISFVLSQHYLLTVQEEPDYDCFEPIRTRIQQNRGVIRRMGAAYLTYALLDALVDGFFPALEAYGDRLESLEDEVVSHPSEKTLHQIYRLKQELANLRHTVWLQRETLASLLRDNDEFMGQDLDVYLRDCYDHGVQLLDIVESYRDRCSGLMDIYLSAISNRMNEVMKTLTVISTIFIPLTFIAGIYGMNFNPEASPYNMPELNWYWGYVAVWVVMGAIAAGLMYFFWRRGWFRNLSR
ncbi:magnesium/cobalt transporter CorA [Nodosilinea sp. LEGE 07088]|uniref:magnesium/cobalt transporter CorA n=1 Tax=Nodosilinea sp. LEGE 07088 TaxID=2777968 RepID=UPI001881A940|nr:magnesium/cobalt transporter CorA [Nodosilinea sp. LEGE 07088]MBE9136353.1 magnesium/cobalt transporter CorA [Nodosilinea sp. LEGE 07088]